MILPWKTPLPSEARLVSCNRKINLQWYIKSLPNLSWNLLPLFPVISEICPFSSPSTTKFWTSLFLLFLLKEKKKRAQNKTVSLPLGLKSPIWIQAILPSSPNPGLAAIITLNFSFSLSKMCYCDCLKHVFEFFKLVSLYIPDLSQVYPLFTISPRKSSMPMK